jgi:DHA1 family inner membrane transport protein
MPVAVLALTAAAFSIGTSEFVIMGLLPDVARDLSVSVPAAGRLVSGYALGVVVGAPILAITTAHLPRRTTPLALMASFVAGNLLCAVSPSHWWLFAARIVTAFSHGAFFRAPSTSAMPREPGSEASPSRAGLSTAQSRAWVAA